MKKIAIIFSLCLFFNYAAEAQKSKEDLQFEMNQMMQQMEEMMRHFGGWMSDAPIIMDTTIVREFHFPAEEFEDIMEQFPMDGLTNMMFQFSPDSLMNTELFKGMEEMMEQWSTQDFSDMEDFFRDMEKLMPAHPDSDSNNQTTPKEGATPKKKRKTTKM